MLWRRWGWNPVRGNPYILLGCSPEEVGVAELGARLQRLRAIAAARQELEIAGQRVGRADVEWAGQQLGRPQARGLWAVMFPPVPPLGVDQPVRQVAAALAGVRRGKELVAKPEALLRLLRQQAPEATGPTKEEVSRLARWVVSRMPPAIPTL